MIWRGEERRVMLVSPYGYASTPDNQRIQSEHIGTAVGVEKSGAIVVDWDGVGRYPMPPHWIAECTYPAPSVARASDA